MDIRDYYIGVIKKVMAEDWNLGPANISDDYKQQDALQHIEVAYKKLLEAAKNLKKAPTGGAENAQSLTNAHTNLSDLVKEIQSAMAFVEKSEALKKSGKLNKKKIED
ncbi:MAG: hypothetical protein WC783_00085 [Candidatus Paceibacterota bacterium]|jgi:hypothetical protein